MTPPRLEACYFGEGLGGQWPRLAVVLAYSTVQHCPDWRCTIACRPMPLGRVSEVSHTANTAKVEYWSDVVAAAADGDRLLLVDVDTMIVGKLDAIWEHSFDVGYTTCAPAARLPFNAGVIAVRVSDRTRTWFRAWRDLNRRMRFDRVFHETWRRQYGGLNQAALGYLLEHPQHGAIPGWRGIHLRPLSGLRWNCEDSWWQAFDPEHTRIVHIKSGLRLAIFGGDRIPTGTERIVKRWRALEQTALGRPAAAR